MPAVGGSCSIHDFQAAKHSPNLYQKKLCTLIGLILSQIGIIELTSRIILVTPQSVSVIHVTTASLTQWRHFTDKLFFPKDSAVYVNNAINVHNFT